MKKLVLLFLLMYAFSSQAQVIQNLTVDPPNPTETDHIKIIADLSFSSAPCSDHVLQFSINGNKIYASAMHCLGMLTVICNYTDTFDIGTLAQGTYRFYLQADNGFGPSPCTPGIVAGPQDSVDIVVAGPTAREEIRTEATTINYMHGSNKILLHFASPVNNGKACLYNATGQLLRQVSIKGLQQSIATGGFPEGLYILELSSEQGRITRRLVIGD